MAENPHNEMLAVIEPTVPRGTTVGIIREMLENYSGLKVENESYLAHGSKRTALGRAIEKLLHAPRVVGGIGPWSTAIYFLVDM